MSDNRMPKELVLSDLPQLHMHIGECIFATRPVLIHTVLGSCVTVTFYHPSTQTAGACHAMLPESNGSCKTGDGCCKYTDSAIEQMHERFTNMGIHPRDVIVKLFGGSFSLNTEKKEHIRALVDVGGRNVDVAKKQIVNLGYTLQVEDVLGSSGRKLFFHTGTGDVWLKRLEKIKMKAAND